MEGGREGCRIIVLIATASTPDFPRVFRDADSQIRDFPAWSVHEIFWNSIHFASLEGSGSMAVTLGEEGMSYAGQRSWW